MLTYLCLDLKLNQNQIINLILIKDEKPTK